MNLLFLVAPLLFSYFLNVSVDARSINFPKNPCQVATPLLSSEVLDPNDLSQLVKAYYNLDARDDDESGGTPGYYPGADDPAQYAQLRPWVAPNAMRLSAINPNSTGLYYRDQVMNLTAYPWNAIGRVFFKRFAGDKGGWCSGSMVGRNLLLTASHCFPWGYGPGRWMRFVPGYANETEPYGSSYVSQCRGVRNTFNVTGIDYIVCHLCKPLGDRTGWMGTQWWRDADEYMNRTWSSSGYPADSFNGKAQMLVSNISLIEIDYHGTQGKELESNVFASAGWSGGPMWDYIDGEAKIVGVCSGGEKDCSEQVGGCLGVEDESTYHDVSAGGKLMTELVLYGMAHWNDNDGGD